MKGGANNFKFLTHPDAPPTRDPFTFDIPDIVLASRRLIMKYMPTAMEDIIVNDSSLRNYAITRSSSVFRIAWFEIFSHFDSAKARDRSQTRAVRKKRRDDPCAHSFLLCLACDFPKCARTGSVLDFIFSFVLLARNTATTCFGCSYQPALAHSRTRASAVSLFLSPRESGITPVSLIAF